MNFQLTLFITVLTFRIATAATISGIVFVDTNGNGIRDRNETGLKGVAVSDQVNVVATDANGFYQIAAARGNGFVFVTLPQGYKAVRSFYSKVDLNRGNSQVDFALTKSAPATQFKFIHASDTHLDDKSLDRMQKLRSLIDSVRPEFVIVTGDLIRDALRVGEKTASSLFEMYKGEIQKISTQVWNAPGNHEIFGIERELSKVSADNPLYGRKMYRYYLGPDYYSFNFGGIHFVALNSVDFEDMWYYGSIDSVQREWLKKDLSLCAPSMPVVTFQHIPFFSGAVSLTGFIETGPGRTLEKVKGQMQLRHVVSNADEVITLLRSHPYPLALAGHNHARQRLFLETEGQQTRFEQTGAVVGPSGEGNYKLPSGVVLYEVRDGEIDEGTFIPIK